mgnify:CR=1 FL=1
MGTKELGIRPVIEGESSSRRNDENILLPHVPHTGNPESPVPRYKHPPPVEHPGPGQTNTTTHLGQNPREEDQRCHHTGRDTVQASHTADFKRISANQSNLETMRKDYG